MKHIFLFVGVVIGIFYAQIYSALNVNPAEYLMSLSVQKQPEQSHAQKKPEKPKFVQSKKEVAPIPPAKHPNVVLYATSWCPHCKRAREYFSKNGIAYLEYDIEKSEQAKRMYDLVGGQGVPLILVNRTKIQGFNQAKFEAIYK